MISVAIVCVCSGACPQVKSGTELHTSGKASKEAEFFFFFRLLDWGIITMAGALKFFNDITSTLESRQ